MISRINRVVLALGAYTLNRHGEPVNRGRKPVEDAARRSFGGEQLSIVSIGDFQSFEKLFDPTVEAAQNHDLMAYAGAASGQFIQEALEGNKVTDIHFDLTGITDVLQPSQAASELRNLIAHLRAECQRNVDIHFRHAAGLSTIRKDGEVVEGTPLPTLIRKYLSRVLFPDAAGHSAARED